MISATPVQAPPLKPGPHLLVQGLSELVFDKLSKKTSGCSFGGAPLDYGIIHLCVSTYIRTYLESLPPKPQISDFIRCRQTELIASTGHALSFKALLTGACDGLDKAFETELASQFKRLGILQPSNWKKNIVSAGSRNRRFVPPVVPFLLMRMKLKWLTDPANWLNSAKAKRPNQNITPENFLCEYMGKDPGLPDVYKEKLLSEHFRRRWSEYQKCITMIMDRRTQRLNQALQHNPQLVSEKPEIATLFPHQAFLNAAGSKSSPYPGLKTAKEEKIERMRTAAAAEGHKLVPSMTLSDICEAAFELVASKSPEFGPPLSKYPAAKQLRAMGIIAE